MVVVCALCGLRGEGLLHGDGGAGADGAAGALVADDHDGVFAGGCCDRWIDGERFALLRVVDLGFFDAVYVDAEGGDVATACRGAGGYGEG
jgi:hypothetical protein